jgi:hypothetical protein
MPSPFPGMDPYLESDTLWASFQHQLVLCLYQILLPALVDRYRASVVQRHYTAERIEASSLTARECFEEYIEIRLRADKQLVSLLDVVSPSNKTTTVGREAYLNTRREAKSAGANLIEIDLVLQGQPTLEYSRDGLPEWDYAVTVTRSAKPEQYEIYTATLQKRLPRFRLPLAADDRETVLDLTTAVARCYDQGGFTSKIDYRLEPAVPLSQANRHWLDELLRAQNLRGQDETLLHERIAIAAYYLWQQAGCPHGHDREHWYKAIDLLRQQASPVVARSP